MPRRFIFSFARWLRAGFVACALLLIPSSVHADSEEEFSAGPLASLFKLTLSAGTREEVLGPHYYEETAADHEVSAMPPFWSQARDLETGAYEFDVLYPVFTYDRFGDEYRVQLGQMLSFSGGRMSQTDTNTSRFTLFPFYYQQRSPVPEKNYTAVWPFYGQLKNRMFRDETEFVLWPVYVKTRRLPKLAPESPQEEFLEPFRRLREKRRGDITTYNFFAPFIHVRTGAGLKGWQFWPLAGWERKEPFVSTNQWEDAVVDGGHEKMFALWPLYFQVRMGMGTTNEERQSVLLPFYSKMTSPLRDSTTIPWPIGVTFTDDRARRYREWGAPWPLVVFARGEGKTASRVWPFYSHARSASLESMFFLWPLYKCNWIHSPPLERERKRVLLFLYSDTTEQNTETGRVKRRVDAWPFFTFTRDWEGNERWQTFSILEPLLPTSKSIERNYSHLWSVVRAEHNAATGARSESLLWNLYRHQGTATNLHSSLLFGLVQWTVTPQGRTSRWFHIPADVPY